MDIPIPQTPSITKDDFLALLTEGLKTDQTFAHRFSDTVLRDFSRNLRITPAQIQVDSGEIGDALTREITKQIQANSDSIASKMIDTVDLSLRNPKPVDFDLGSLFKVSDSESRRVRVHREAVVRKALTAIERSVPNVAMKDVSLSDLMYPGRSKEVSAVSTRNTGQWRILQDRVFRVLQQASQQTPRMDISGKMSISDIYKPPQTIANTANALNIRRYFAWSRFQGKILDSLTSSVNADTFRFNSRLSLNDIFDIPRSSSILTRFKWMQTQSRILDKMREADVTVSPLLPSQSIRTSPEKPQYKSIREEDAGVRITGISDQALRDLRKLSLPNITKLIQDKPGRDTSQLMKTIGAVLGGVALGGLAIKSLFDGFEDTGELKGTKILTGKVTLLSTIKLLKSTVLKLGEKFGAYLMKLPSALTKPLQMFFKNAMQIGGKLVSNTSNIVTKIPIASTLARLGGKIAKGLRFIPFVGSMIDFYDAHKRFEQGKWGTGILSILSGVISLVPGAGALLKGAASIGIGIFNAITDWKTGKSDEVIDTNIDPSTYKKKLNFGKAFSDWMHGVLGKVVKRLPPFIQSILKRTEAFKDIVADLPDEQQQILNEFETSERNREIQKLYDKIRNEEQAVRRSEQGQNEYWGRENEGRRKSEQSIIEMRARISELETENRKLQPTEKQNDFIWRSGQRVQAFNKNDNIISTQDSKLFNKLVQTVSDSSSKDQTSKLIDVVGLLRNDFQKMFVHLNNMTQAIYQVSKQPQQPVNVKGAENLPPINTSESRDPAYVFKSRVWGRFGDRLPVL